MSDKMYPIPFHHLLKWITLEYRNQQSIFGIPAGNFYLTPGPRRIKIGDQYCERPLGPAAGPHTQMTQNIVAAFLTGARFFELKTVQTIDDLEIPKPCISAEIEGYNTEWSTELSVPQAFDEYLKAWLLIPYVKMLLAGSFSNPAGGFVFNMSVGYDLAGIRSPKIDRFIESMKSACPKDAVRRAAQIPQFGEYLSILGEELKHAGYAAFDSDEVISPHISSSITLSTMHGCPPDEIEAIARYLISEKHLHTSIKLNPTLLGYDFVRSALDRNGFPHIQLNHKSFDNDLQFNQAQPMLTRLQSLANSQGLHFSVKLSNTLPVKNDRGILPGDEMYMSGQALYPLTINLAFRLAQVYDGDLPISFSGGAELANISAILSTGIAPITLATNLLKPGGYLRLKQLAEEIDKHPDSWKNGKVDLELLGRLAELAIPPAQKHIFIDNKPIPKTDRGLPLFDCFIAPCQERCPIHQDVATYLKLMRAGEYNSALGSILAQNPLPNITGYICDHQCMTACTRNYYDNPLTIRDLKRIAADKGTVQPKTSFATTGQSCAETAVIGAGPAGLAAAYFLARTGLPVTIFDKNPLAGGTVRFVIPGFRLPEEAIERDIQFIASHGVEFVFGQKSDLTTEDLRQRGFRYIILAIGAGHSPSLNIKTDNTNIIEAVEFLKKFKADVSDLLLGSSVAVIGGGNSAMDAARVARLVAGVRQVHIIYRRTIAQMPADREELENALADGVIFRELITPVEFSKDGILKCQYMKLGEPDASGRPRPVPVNEFEDLRVDTLITAIGEQVDQNYLRKIGLNPDKHGKVNVNATTNETDSPDVFIGGDAFRGPATVVEAIADGRKIAASILSRERMNLKLTSESFRKIDSQIHGALYLKKGEICPSGNQLDSPAAINAEADRCLECDLLCTRCVDVCPNRANIAVAVNRERQTGKGNGHFKDAWQIVHLDALCNECGNCATFCPYENGRPYRDKFTIFHDEASFTKSQNSGFARSGSIFLVRTDGQVWHFDPLKTPDPNENSLNNWQVIRLIQNLMTDYPYL